MKQGILPTKSEWKSVLFVGIIFVGLALGFTAIGVGLAPEGAQVGGTRPGGTIPVHVLELAGIGLLLGLASMAFYGRKGLHLAVLAPILTVLLDVDHLPAYLGIAQPIRPDHSIVFAAVTLAVTAITIKALDVDLIVLSAIMGHMAVDTGIFAPLSPINFDYVQLDPYRLPLAAGAVFCALAAGAVNRKRQRVEETEGIHSSA